MPSTRPQLYKLSAQALLCFAVLLAGPIVSSPLDSALQRVKLEGGESFQAFADSGASSRSFALEELSKRVEQWRLSNGMTVLFFKRETAPVFAGQVWVKVGGVDEQEGSTGIAHFLEHMAFKGTKVIGTKNYEAEKPLLDKLEQIITSASDQNEALASKEVQSLYQQLGEYWVDNDFGRNYTKAGASGLNAMTSKDYTSYVVKLPSVAFELWCWMESDRLINPVFRQFYKEREVVQEERRRGYDDDPGGKLYETLLETAFTTHPNRLPIIGYSKDLKQITATDMRKFYNTHYRPEKIVLSLVGNLPSETVREFTERYFGPFKAVGPKSEESIPVEPPQVAPREKTLSLDAQPQLIMAYHKPTVPDPADAHFSVLHSLLAEGRSSLFHKILVEKEKLALGADTGEAPGERYPNLFLVSLTPAPGVSNEKLAQRVQEIFDEISKTPPDGQLVEDAKKRSRVSFLKLLDSDEGLATVLGKSQAIHGDWREIIRYFDVLEKTTSDDVSRLAAKFLRPENRTVAKIESAPSPGQ